MSVKELEEQVSKLPPEELSEFDVWWESRRRELLGKDEGETEAVKSELRSRKQEYLDHPERFVRMDENDIKQMFARIAHARTHQTSAR